MTLEELRKGYMGEVNYQKHMLRNLRYWFQLFLSIGAIGVVLIYYFQHKTTWLFIMGIVFLVIGGLGMLIFGYGEWKGRQNVELVIDDYQKKLNYIHHHVKKSSKKNLKH